MGTVETRERIVSSARAVFTERGVQASTVQHVLEAAGISRRTFYQYFDSKEAVLSAVYDEVMNTLVRSLASRIRGTSDPVAKVTEGVDAWLDLQVDGGPLFVALQAEAIRPDSLLHARRERALDGIANAIDEAVREALGVAVDPLVFRGVAIGIEGIVLHMAQGHVLSDRARLRRIANALLFSVLSNARELPDPPREPAEEPGARHRS